MILRPLRRRPKESGAIGNKRNTWSVCSGPGQKSPRCHTLHAIGSHSLIAQHGEPRDMGEIMGISNSLISLANTVLPVAATYIYSAWKGDFFVLIAVLPAIALLLALRLQTNSRGPLSGDAEPNA